MIANETTQRNMVDQGHIDETIYGRSSPSIVNPITGLANDYLNVFNEILLMIENVPVMPEMVDEMLVWSAVSYQHYFEQSKLSESAYALNKYMSLSSTTKQEFDQIVDEMRAMSPDERSISEAMVATFSSKR
jgi:hypothetical protein